VSAVLDASVLVAALDTPFLRASIVEYAFLEAVESTLNRSSSRSGQ